MKTKTEIKEAKHTPTPWHYSKITRPGSDFAWLISGNNSVIAEILKHNTYDALRGKNWYTSKQKEADQSDAAFIVKAVNSHEALLEAAKLLLKVMDSGKEGKPLTYVFNMKEYLQTKNAISLAERGE